LTVVSDFVDFFIDQQLFQVIILPEDSFVIFEQRKALLEG
jgi:hypothetical protein